MEIQQKEYDYHLRLGKFKLALLFIVIGIVYSLFQFKYNRDTYKLFYLFVLNAEQSKIFFLVLGILLLIILGGTVLFSLLVREKIILSGSGAILPKMIAAGNSSNVLYGDVLQVYEEIIKKQRIATVVTKGGKKYTITSENLASQADYEEVLAALSSSLKKNGQRIG